ncbi:MAG: hypothetical protein H3C62_15730 [Gemmatimonadaceae bacterium]|nr:hypothetical protein [Gemmatimonadaceae bacterium]
MKDAIESYFSTKGTRLKPRTVANYRPSADRFLEWATIAGVRLADDLRPHHLGAFVEWLCAQHAKAPRKGGKRGEQAATGRSWTPGGINNRLRAIKAVLNKLRKMGRLPHITGDAISDTIELVKTEKPRPAFLRQSEIKGLLRAALRHDEATFEMTRAEKGVGQKGQTPKYPPVAPFVAFMLLTGCRAEEALSLLWSDIDLDAKDATGKVAGAIHVPAHIVKTGQARTIDLSVCPALRRILCAIKLKAAGEPFVFGGATPWTRETIDDGRERLIETFGAPPFTWSQRSDGPTGEKPPVRATCGTYLTNAPGIYGAASAFLAAKRLGHSVTIAERHYAGVIHGLPKTAKTLEAAMEVTKELAEIEARICGKERKEEAAKTATAG